MDVFDIGIRWLRLPIDRQLAFPFHILHLRQRHDALWASVLFLLGSGVQVKCFIFLCFWLPQLFSPKSLRGDGPGGMAEQWIQSSFAVFFCVLLCFALLCSAGIAAFFPFVYQKIYHYLCIVPRVMTSVR